MFFTLSKDFLRCPALALQFILFCDSLSILPHTSPFVNPFFLITPLFGILYGFKSDKISLFVFFVLYPFLDFTQYKHYNVSNFIILIKESRSLEEKMWALKAAFPHTIPVLTGFLILGAAYGILMSQARYSWFWTVLTCTFVFAGSMQFLSVGLLPFGFHPASAVLMTLMVNARHIFYGISMLQKFKGTGRLKPYLIFSLCDETFSLLCTVQPPVGISAKWFMFFIALLDHVYWIMGGLLGSVLGSFLTFNTKGIDFVLTALFVVIFINQWKATKNHLPVVIGVTASLICLLLFGPSNFLIPAMILILLLITLLKKPMEKEELL